MIFTYFAHQNGTILSIYLLSIGVHCQWPRTRSHSIKTQIHCLQRKERTIRKTRSHNPSLTHPVRPGQEPVDLTGSIPRKRRGAASHPGTKRIPIQTPHCPLLTLSITNDKQIVSNSIQLCPEREETRLLELLLVQRRSRSNSNSNRRTCRKRTNS